MRPTCQATIEFADDYGDTPCTFHCMLPEGHNGDHEETGELFGQTFRVTWKGEREKEPWNE